MVFLLNGLVFVLIGLQLPRILHTLSGPLSETASLPRRADKLRRHCCAHRLGFYIDLPAAFHERFLAQKRPVSGVAERSDCCVDRDARCCVARGCTRGAADAFGRQPFSRARLHFVYHLLRDSGDARAPRV